MRSMAGENGESEADAVEEEQPQPEAQDKELAEVKDRLLRMAAEFDNFKKKMAKDMDASRTMGKAEL